MSRDESKIETPENQCTEDGSCWIESVSFFHDRMERCFILLQ